MHFLLDINSSTATNYLPIAIQFIFVIGFIGTMLALSAITGPSVKQKTN